MCSSDVRWVKNSSNAVFRLEDRKQNLIFRFCVVYKKRIRREVLSTDKCNKLIILKVLIMHLGNSFEGNFEAEKRSMIL